MKEKIVKLLEVKSIVTLLLIGTLVTAVLWCLIRTDNIPEALLTLFISSVSSVITYFFTKKDNTKNNEQ